MIHIFKNLNFGGLLALVAGVVLMVSWKENEDKQTFQWYRVADNGPNLSDKVIVEEYPGGSPTTPCTSDDSLLPLCAVELDLPASVNLPITMQDVADNSYPENESRHQIANP